MKPTDPLPDELRRIAEKLLFNDLPLAKGLGESQQVIESAIRATLEYCRPWFAHKPSCDLINPQSKNNHKDKWECDCGLSALLSGEGAKEVPSDH